MMSERGITIYCILLTIICIAILVNYVIGKFMDKSEKAQEVYHGAIGIEYLNDNYHNSGIRAVDDGINILMEYVSRYKNKQEFTDAVIEIASDIIQSEMMNDLVHDKVLQSIDNVILDKFIRLRLADNDVIDRLFASEDRLRKLKDVRYNSSIGTEPVPQNTVVDSHKTDISNELFDFSDI